LKDQAKEKTESVKTKIEDKIHHLEAKGAESIKATKQEVVDKAEQILKETKVGETAEEATAVAQKYWSGANESVRRFIDYAPNHLTEFKRHYIFPVNRDYRSIAHVGFTLAFFAASWRFKKNVFVSLKNTAVAAVVTGFLFNPEPFNPFLKRNLFYNPK